MELEKEYGVKFGNQIVGVDIVKVGWLRVLVQYKAVYHYWDYPPTETVKHAKWVWKWQLIERN